MAGYSGTPLPKKLGLKPGLRVLLVAPPPDIDGLLAGAPAFQRLARLAPFDFALAFVTTRSALVRELDRLQAKLVDVKVCAIDATWAGLKLVRRVALRATKKRD